jgi:hypothetical protein
MQEAEWLANGEGAWEMIEALKKLGRADARKLRLYACAWARWMWEGLGHKTHKHTVELAEDFADGLIAYEELAEACDVAVEYRELYETTYDQESICPGRVAFATADQDAAYAASDAAYHARNVFARLPHAPVLVPQRGEEERLMREIFGNPFRPASIDPAWLTPAGGSVAKLARAAYHERALPAGTLDPARLAVLADALEEEGCKDKEILAHLRGPGPHVRGCWVVDLILEESGGFAVAPKGRKKRAAKVVEARGLNTVDDILAAASRLTANEITRLQEGLLRLEQERNKPQPRKKKKK